MASAGTTCPGTAFNQDSKLALRSAFDRIKKKVASAPKRSIASAMSEADEKAGALAQYFQARPAKASPKHPDVEKMAFCALGAYSGLATAQRARSAPKTQSRDVPASITDTGLGHSTENAAANPTERNMSTEEGTGPCRETVQNHPRFGALTSWNRVCHQYCANGNFIENGKGRIETWQARWLPTCSPCSLAFVTII